MDPVGQAESLVDAQHDLVGDPRAHDMDAEHLPERSPVDLGDERADLRDGRTQSLRQTNAATRFGSPAQNNPLRATSITGDGIGLASGGHTRAFAVPRPVLDGLGEVGGRNAIAAVEIGNRASEAEHTVIGAGGQAQAADRGMEQRFAGRVDRAVFSDVGGRSIWAFANSPVRVRKRTTCCSRAATTRSRTAADGSPGRSSVSCVSCSAGTSTCRSMRSSSGPGRRARDSAGSRRYQRCSVRRPSRRNRRDGGSWRRLVSRRLRCGSALLAGARPWLLSVAASLRLSFRVVEPHDEHASCGLIGSRARLTRRLIVPG